MSANQAGEEGPWNPGLTSQIPREFLPLATIHRPENVTGDLRAVLDLAQFCGLPAKELVTFRAERLVVHEVLIRVTADLTVYDGRQYEDLGINFRRMVSTILDKHLVPHQPEWQAVYERTRARIENLVRQELTARLFPPEVAPAPEPAVSKDGFWGRLFTRGTRQPVRADVGGDPAGRRAERLGEALSGWKRAAASANDDLEGAVYAQLARVVGHISGRHGRLVGDLDLIAGIVTNMVANDICSGAIGDALEADFSAAVTAEGYRRLPRQDKPVVMNIKGASASGKSTMRPLQKKLAEKLGVPWEDFALISPDIWRKYLLDYASLGRASKYAGMLTGEELAIIDRKLDRYMARKAAAGKMTHLLIDRFRFDSFVPEMNADEPVRLLTRFGDLVYMYFMITPPEATVERAWRRGRMFGRYKAVDDLLHHNIEAYSGIPDLFLTWALSTDKRVHCEFLDNSVPLGTVPRTVAFGWNGELNILSVPKMVDIDRYRKIEVFARGPGEVYGRNSMAAADNVEFLGKLKSLLPAINFCDARTGRVYLRISKGHFVWRDPVELDHALRDGETRDALEALGLPSADAWPADAIASAALNPRDAQTLGSWGPDAIAPVAGRFAG